MIFDTSAIPIPLHAVSKLIDSSLDELWAYLAKRGS